MVGIAIGALLAAVSAGRFRVQIDGARKIGLASRIILVLLGGVFSGFGSRIAAGCTSGIGLSGTAMLSVGGFIFLVCFFVAGLMLSALMRRAW